MTKFMNPDNYHDLYPKKNPRKLIFTKINEYTVLFLGQFVIKSQKRYLISKKSKLKDILIQHSHSHKNSEPNC